MSQPLRVFHFASDTLRDGTPLPQAGDELPERLAVMGESGWHGCERAMDALGYSTGPYLALRELHGTIETGVDRLCASNCRMVTGYVDATDVLREFAVWCADRAARYSKRVAAAALGAWDDDTYAAAYAAASYAARAAAGLDAQEDWLRPRLLALLGQEDGE